MAESARSAVAGVPCWKLGDLFWSNRGRLGVGDLARRYRHRLCRDFYGFRLAGFTGTVT